jgi:hypothetical protein
MNESVVYYGDEGVVVLHRGSHGERVILFLSYSEYNGWFARSCVSGFEGATYCETNVSDTAPTFTPDGGLFISMADRRPLPSFANDSRKFDTRGR